MSPRRSQAALPLNGDQPETFNHRPPLKEHSMEPRLNFFKSGPEAMKAMAGLDQQIARSGLEKSLVERVRLRASQLNGCRSGQVRAM
jgi:alkylhydroperoxidase family enzyme